MKNKILAILALILAALACSPPPIAPRITPPVATPTLILASPTATPTPTIAPVPVSTLATGTDTGIVMCVREGETWNMRQYPTDEARIITVLVGGAECEILLLAGDWNFAQCAGYTGFVHRFAFQKP